MGHMMPRFYFRSATISETSQSRLVTPAAMAVAAQLELAHQVLQFQRQARHLVAGLGRLLRPGRRAKCLQKDPSCGSVRHTCILAESRATCPTSALRAVPLRMRGEPSATTGRAKENDHCYEAADPGGVSAPGGCRFRSSSVWDCISFTTGASEIRINPGTRSKCERLFEISGIACRIAWRVIPG